MISNGTTRRARRWGNGARLASGVLLTTALIGGAGTVHPAAHASIALRATTEDLAPAPTPTLFPFSVDLLEKTIANLTEATKVLNELDTSGYPNFASFVSSQISTQSLTVNFLSNLQTIEENVISNAGGSAFFTNLLLSLYNMSWHADSTSALSLDNLVATGIDSNLPFYTGLGNMGLFFTDLSMFGKSTLAMIVSFVTNLGALSQHVTPATAAVEPAVAGPHAAVPDFLPPNQSDDIAATIATQANDGPASNQILNNLGLDTIASQILTGDWKSPLQVMTEFFEQSVANQMNPEAFINGLSADTGNPMETDAYQLDQLLDNSVYATDLNAAAATLWP